MGEVDLLRWNELSDLDGLATLDLRLLEVLVGDHDELILGVLVALLDVLPRDFNALSATHAFVLDRGVVFLVELTEGDLGLAFGRRIEADRNRDQPERHCTFPNRPWHMKPPWGL